MSDDDAYDYGPKSSVYREPVVSVEAIMLRAEDNA